MVNKKRRDMGYTNISKKERKKRAKENRGDTFEGYRSTYFKDKTKYNRQRDKKIENWED